jgi:hypothetical protein
MNWPAMPPGGGRGYSAAVVGAGLELQTVLPSLKNSVKMQHRPRLHNDGGTEKREGRMRKRAQTAYQSIHDADAGPARIRRLLYVVRLATLVGVL